MNQVETLENDSTQSHRDPASKLDCPDVKNNKASLFTARHKASLLDAKHRAENIVNTLNIEKVAEREKFSM